MRKSISLIATTTVVLATGLTTSFAADSWKMDPLTNETAVETGVEHGINSLAPACSLVVPASVTRGQTFNLEVGYNPCVTGGRVETWTIYWPTTLSTFAEKSVYEKRFFSGTSCISGSLDRAVAPLAGAITGTATVKVEVQGEGFYCSATTTMQVN